MTEPVFKRDSETDPKTHPGKCGGHPIFLPGVDEGKCPTRYVARLYVIRKMIGSFCFVFSRKFWRSKIFFFI